MKILKKLPIGVQLSLLITLIIVIVFFIVFMNYSKASEVVEKKNSEYLSGMIDQINQTIASNSDGLKRILESTAYNSTIVQAYLNESDPLIKFEIYNKLIDYMLNMKGMKDGIIDVSLFGSDGTIINLNGGGSYFAPFIEEIPDNKLFYFSGVQEVLIGSFKRNVFIMGCPIYSITDFSNSSRIGTLMLIVDANSLAGLMGSSETISEMREVQFYALDRYGQVFSTNDKSIAIGTQYSAVGSTNSENYFMEKGVIPDIDGELIFKLPRSKLLRGIETIRSQSFFILVISLGLLIIPFTLVVNNILRPLKILIGFMSDFKLGRLSNLSKRINLQGYAEVSIMANHFNRMLDEIDVLTKSLLDTNTKLYKAEINKKQAELAFLHNQINPHFLYNTLESIKGLAVEEGADRIFQMVKSLAFVFRYSVKAADIVALQEEITLVKSHIYIQQIRFNNRFTVTYHFEDSILACQVPKMILQPLVENAIFHGIEPKTGSGHLVLVGKKSGGDLLLSVSDNGCGIDIWKLKELQECLLKVDETIHLDSIGLVNVNNRIKLYYGDAYGIRLNSKQGEGTLAVIRLPLLGVQDV